MGDLLFVVRSLFVSKIIFILEKIRKVLYCLCMDKTTIETYDAYAKEYDEETADFWGVFPKNIVETFSENISGDKKILNVGSGPGRDGLLLKNAGLDVVCLDASPVMVELAQSRGLEAVLGDFMSLDFKDSTFDGVWAYTSLLHVPKEEAGEAMSEIKRVLKQNGILCLGLIEGEEEVYRQTEGVEKPRWFSFYSESEIQKLLQEYGFEIISFNSFTPNKRRYLNYVARKNRE